MYKGIIFKTGIQSSNNKSQKKKKISEYNYINIGNFFNTGYHKVN